MSWYARSFCSRMFPNIFPDKSIFRIGHLIEHKLTRFFLLWFLFVKIWIGLQDRSMISASSIAVDCYLMAFFSSITKRNSIRKSITKVLLASISHVSCARCWKSRNSSFNFLCGINFKQLLGKLHLELFLIASGWCWLLRNKEPQCFNCWRKKTQTNVCELVCSRRIWIALDAFMRSVKRFYDDDRSRQLRRIKAHV